MKHIIVAVLVLVSSAALGGDATGYSIQGGHSCGAFIAGLQKDSIGKTADSAWMAGFITGYNFGTPDTYDILGNTDFLSARLWMENYCKQNPLSNLSEGMDRLTVELYPRRHKTAKEAGR